jgi:hypothetical protein
MKIEELHTQLVKILLEQLRKSLHAFVFLSRAEKLFKRGHVRPINPAFYKLSKSCTEVDQHILDSWFFGLFLARLSSRYVYFFIDLNLS